jgi:hypothetical protein
MAGSKRGERRGGRQKGTPNKFNGALREMVLGALSDLGGQAWLRNAMDKNQPAALALLGKILPMAHQHAGPDGGPIIYRWQDSGEESA